MLAVIANGKEADSHCVGNFRNGQAPVQKLQHPGLPGRQGFITGIRVRVFGNRAFRRLRFRAAQVNESVLAWPIEQHQWADREFLLFLEAGREIELKLVYRLVIECRGMDWAAFAAERIAEHVPARKQLPATSIQNVGFGEPERRDRGPVPGHDLASAVHRKCSFAGFKMALFSDHVLRITL